MLFVIFSIDKSVGAKEIRAQTRPAHLAFMKTLGERVKAGGPVFSADGESPFGGMYVLEADSHEQALTIARQDPYVQAGLYEKQYVQPWRWNTNRPETVAPW